MVGWGSRISTGRGTGGWEDKKSECDLSALSECDLSAWIAYEVDLAWALCTMAMGPCMCACPTPPTHATHPPHHQAAVEVKVLVEEEGLALLLLRVIRVQRPTGGQGARGGGREFGCELC